MTDAVLSGRDILVVNNLHLLVMVHEPGGSIGIVVVDVDGLSSLRGKGDRLGRHSLDETESKGNVEHVSQHLCKDG